MKSYSIKVLFIIYSYPPEVVAGWQNFTKELAEEFVKMGYKVTVIVSRSKMFKVQKVQSLKIIRIPQLHVPFIRYIFELFATLFLSIIVFPDVIFGMSLSPGGIISSFLGKMLKAKNFLYVIGREFIEGHKFFRKFIATIFCQLSDKILCASEFVKNNLPKSKSIEKKAVISPLFINTSYLAPYTLSITRNSNKFTILYVGRLIKEKGLDILIGAFKILIKNEELKMNNRKLYLRIVGSGPEENRYKELAEKYLDKDLYEFLGFIEKKDLPLFFRDADLFVLPSRSETFGLVLLEANYFGLPVVATDVWGIPYIVKNGINGILVKPTPKSIADGIETLINDKELYNRIKQNAKEHSMQFSKERILKQLLTQCKIQD